MNGSGRPHVQEKGSAFRTSATEAVAGTVCALDLDDVGALVGRNERQCQARL